MKSVRIVSTLIWASGKIALVTPHHQISLVPAIKVISRQPNICLKIVSMEENILTILTVSIWFAKIIFSRFCFYSPF